jgi:branched-chain amino acid transport system substrate-binding protein
MKAKKKENRGRKVLGILLVFFFLLGILWVSPSLAQAPTKVRIFFLGNMTGSYAATETPAFHGWVTTWKWLNKNQYIPGVEVVADWGDAGSDVSKAMSLYKTAMSGATKPVCFQSMNSAQEIALRPWFERDQIPDVTPGGAPGTLWPPSYIFSYIVPYVNQVGAYVDYAKKSWKQSRKPKFGFLTWDNAFGRCIVTDDVINYIKSQGFEYVGAEFFPGAVTEVTTQLLALKNRGADFVYTNTLSAQYAVVLRDFASLGLKMSQMQMGACVWVDPRRTADIAGEAAEGFLQMQNFEPPSVWSKMPQVMNAFKFGNHPETEFTSEWMSCWIQAHITAEAIKIAAKEVGAKNITGKAIYDALAKVKTDCEGVAKIQYSKDIHWAQTLKIFRVTTKKVGKTKFDSVYAEAATDWFAPPNLMK